MFRISTKGEYGLLLMAALAENNGKGTLSEIAKKKKLPYYYLMRLASLLSRAGLIRGLRGRGGGYVLAKSPDKITVKKILVALEGPLSVTPCTHGLKCKRRKECFPSHFWKSLAEVIERFLENFTLQDIVKEVES